MKCMVKVLSYKVSNLFFPVTSNSKFKVEALSLWDIPCVPAFNMGVDITISYFNHHVKFANRPMVLQDCLTNICL